MENNTASYETIEDFRSSVFLSIIGLLMMIVGTTANLGTIVAFFTDAKIGVQANDLIVLNLAFADFGTVFISTPFKIVVTSICGRWPLGEMACFIIFPFSNIMLAAGFFFIILMSWDRHLMLAVEYSEYLKRMSRKRLKTIIAVMWIVSCAPGVIEMIFWDTMVQNTPPEHHIDFSKTCEGPAARFVTATVIMSLLFAVFPVSVVAIFGVLILLSLRARLKRWQNVGYSQTGESSHDTSQQQLVQSVSYEHEPAPVLVGIPDCETSAVVISDRKVSSSERNQIEPNISQFSSAPSTSKSLPYKEEAKSKLSNRTTDSRNNIGADQCREGTSLDQQSSISFKRPTANQDNLIRKRYIKPIVTYSVLVLALLICSFPIAIYILHGSITCSECYDPETAQYLFALIYFNSCLNPLLYAATNAKIRSFYQRHLRAWSRQLCK